MRRFLCVFLAICCILTMAACASESEPAPAESDTVTAEQPPAESEPAPEETPEEAPEETPEEAEPAEEDAPAEDAAEDAAIEVDEGIFTVTITMPPRTWRRARPRTLWTRRQGLGTMRRPSSTRMVP